jgi:lipopolysaccharide export LptBFGC system permease protein LptF
MSPLQKEVLRRYLQTFVLATIVLTMAIIAFDAGKKLLDEGLSPLETATLLPYLLPGVSRAAMQGATLLAVCLVFGRMAAKSELLALSSSGLSPLGVIWPVIALSVPISLGCVWLEDVSSTWGENNFRRGVAEFAVDITYRHLQSQKSFKAGEYELTVAGVEGRTLIRPNLTRSSTDPEQCIDVHAELGRIEVDHESGNLAIYLQYGRCNMGKVGRLVFTDRFKHSIPLTWKQSDATSLERIREQELRIGEVTAELAALSSSHEREPRMIPLPPIDDATEIVSAIAHLPPTDAAAPNLAAPNLAAPTHAAPTHAARIAATASTDPSDLVSASAALPTTDRRDSFSHARRLSRAAGNEDDAVDENDAPDLDDVAECGDGEHGKACGVAKRRRELEDMLRFERTELFWRQSLWHQKWANSFCCLTFTLIGIPAAVLLRRADPLSSFFVCFLPILALYQPLQYFGMAYSIRGQLNPLWLHANNAALAVAGLYGLTRILRRY